MITAVLDSGVLISAFSGAPSRTGAPTKIARRWLAGEFGVVASTWILGEVERALTTKPYFARRFDVTKRERVLDAIRGNARLLSAIDIIPGVAPHWHDDAILATVAASGADWFVTGDRQLLAMCEYAGVPFTDPNGFLAVLDAGRG